jgi:hypothetical protein
MMQILEKLDVIFSEKQIIKMSNEILQRIIADIMAVLSRIDLFPIRSILPKTSMN